MTKKTKSYFLPAAALAGILLFSTSGFAETIKNIYDDLNRLKRVEYGSGLVIEYTYDEVGNRTQRVVTVNGRTVSVVPELPNGEVYTANQNSGSGLQ